MSLTSAISSGLNGLHANETRVAVASQNLANVATPGFKAYRTDGTDVISGADASAKAPSAPLQSGAPEMSNMSNVDVPTETVNLMIGLNGFKASAKVIEVSNEMLKKTYGLIP